MHFPHNKTTNRVVWTNPTIIVPDSSNYLDTDLMIFDPKDGLFLVCQFTITDPFTKHSRNFFEMKNSINLSAAWKMESDNKIKTMQMLWFSINKNATTYDNDWVIPSTYLESKYVELRGFVVK